MYDTAKRGMAFAVATGGLLLSGPACATAAAAADTGTLGGPVSAHVDPGADHAVRAAASGGGVLSGNSVNIPATIGLNLCGNGVALLDFGSSPADCSSSSGTGSAAVAPRSTHHGGLLSGNSIHTPIGVPVNVCGNSVTIAGIGGSAQGSNCSIGSGSSPKTGIDTGAGGAGLLSANDVEVPITVPVNVCGDGVSAASGGGAAAISCAFAASVAVQKVTTQTGYTDATAGAAGAAASTTTGVSAGAGTATNAQPAGIDTATSAQAGASAGVPQASSTTLAVPAVQPGGAPKGLDSVVPATLPQAAAQPAAPQAAVPHVTAPDVTAPEGTVPEGSVPQVTSPHVQLPITVHPMVIWPRPEPAALATPHPETPADSTAQHGPLADPSEGTLAHTGADTLLPLGLAVGGLSSGAVLLATGRRRRHN